ncbi:S1 family peptidase [Streptomyces sp. NPDC059063]|uniref:S1 family peptidase n=1 Tax=unclassified Streptomyces TaxID=2593676 RepID=UPI0036B61E3D
MRLRQIIAPLLSAALAALGLLTAAPVAGAAAPAATAIRGGDLLYSGSGGRCPIGFNAKNAATFYAIMSGHCVGTVGAQWYADPQHTIQVGVTEKVVFPGSDYAILRYTNTSYTYPSEVNGGAGRIIRINRARQPVVGEPICRTGPSTGWHCGTVQQTNVSITFPQGTVNGLFRANVCAEPGDTGGPAVSGDAALGILVGGSGNCTSGGTTYYQPVVPILSATGLQVGY